MKQNVLTVLFSSAVCLAGVVSAVVPGSDEYVSNGLVMHLDGIDNTLADGVRSHDPAAVTWCDLSENGNDFPIPSFVDVEEKSFLSHANKTKKPDTDATASVRYPTRATLNGLDAGPYASPYTVEVVAQRIKWTYDDNQDNLQPLFSTPRGSVGYRFFTADGFYLSCPKSNSKLALWNVFPGLSAAGIQTISVVFGTNNVSETSIWFGDGYSATATSLQDASYEMNWGTVFGMFGNARADVRIHAVRVYDRVLTEDERKHNYRLDRERFIMKTSFSEIRELEYIESNGRQVIDTGYYPNPLTRIEADLQFIGETANRTGASKASFFGSTEPDGVCAFSMNFGGGADQDNSLYPWLDKTHDAGGANLNFKITPELRTTRQTMTIDAATGSVQYGSVSKSAAQKTTSHSRNALCIFGAAAKTGDRNPFTYYKMRVYGWKIWDGTTLVRDFVPCYRLFDMRAGLWDRVNERFYQNYGTDDFNYALPPTDVSLPPEYHSLDYLVATGTQCIATGVEPANDVTVAAEFLPFKLTGGTFGATAGKRKSFTFDMQDDAYYVNGVRRTNGSRSWFGTGTDISFIKVNDAVRGYGRLYSAYVWKAGELVRRFEPCYRIADNIAGMYDLANGVFHPSEGEEAFLHGAGGETGVPFFGGTLFDGGFKRSQRFSGLRNFSFSVWVRNPQEGDNGQGFERYGVVLAQGALADRAPGFCCFALRDASGNRKLCVQMRTAQNKTCTLKLENSDIFTDDKWHHLAFTHDYDGCSAYLWLDGTVVDSKTSAGDLVLPEENGNIAFTVGTRCDKNGYLEYPYRGNLAYASVWGRALSAAEINDLRKHPVTGTESGLLDAWTFSEGTAGTVSLVTGRQLTLVTADVGYVPDAVKWHNPGMVLIVK